MDKKKITVASPKLTMGQRFADWVSRVVRSWIFVICQIVFIAGWIWWVHSHPGTALDNHSYDILRLILTIESSFIGSIILMSQYRQSEKDRKMLYTDYIINQQTYKEMRQIHPLIDDLYKKNQDK